MGILMVRHGQASAGSADYDCLSERGVEQCRRLGRWLAASGHEFDAVVMGAMKRHAQSAAAVAQGYVGEGSQPLPEPELDHGLNEFDHHGVFDGFTAANGGHEAVRKAAEGGVSQLAPLIHAALGAWAEDRIEGVAESWGVFGQRVAQAGERIRSRGDQRVLVLSSGGVLARLAQAALRAPDRTAIELNMSLRNSGLCEFHLHYGRLSLGSWNSVPHLHDARDMWTYY